MRVLVTGSKGFVGRWLTDHLEASGDTVLGVDMDTDITDAVAIREAVTGFAPDGIIHLAAQASVGASWNDQAETYRTNSTGTLNVCGAAAASSDRPRVLLISSAEVYGRVGPADLPVAESHPFAPISPYAASKAASEMIGIQFALGGGVEVIRARPFNHTGPGQRPDFVVPALARQISEAAASGAKQLLTGNLDAKRDLSDVRDVVRAYRLLLVDGEPGQVYNVCRGESFSIRSVAERLIRLSGVDLEIEVDPARVRAVEIPDLRGDPTRIAQATGWEAETPLDQTLADVLESWKRPAS